jgi:hypothetical protein
VKRVPTFCIVVSGGLTGGMRKRMLEKIVGGGQGKQKYPARKYRACKKRA